MSAKSAASAASGVAAAFLLLSEAIEEENELVKTLVSKSLEQSEHDKAKASVERSKELSAFRGKIEQLYGEWRKLTAAPQGDKGAQTSVVQHGSGRRRKGERTGRQEYDIPVLRVLADMSGKGKTNEVLNRVGELMAPILREVDYVRTSKSQEVGWRNYARWTRQEMVKDGRMRSDSRRGVWEISEKGRASLDRSRLA